MRIIFRGSEYTDCVKCARTGRIRFGGNGFEYVPAGQYDARGKMAKSPSVTVYGSRKTDSGFVTTLRTSSATVRIEEDVTL